MTRALLSAVLLGLGLSATAEAQRIKLSVPVKQLEAAVRQDPNDAVAHYNLAIGYLSEKKYDQADASLKEAIELEPRFALAYLAQSMMPFARRGELWNETLEGRVPAQWRDQVAESDRRYRAAFMMNPMLDLRILGAVTPKRSYLWDAYAELSAAYNDWLRGFDDFREGDYASAYIRLDRLARLYTAAGRQSVKNLPRGILWYRGLAAAHNGNYDVAIRDLRELLDRAEASDEESGLTYLPIGTNQYRYVLATVLHRAAKNDEAAELFREVLKRDAGAYVAHTALANILEQRGDTFGSLLEREAAVAANPEDFTSEIELAVTLARLGRTAEAEAALNRAAAAQPRSPRAWYLLGILQQSENRTAEARASFEKFLETAPSRFPSEIQDAKRRIAQMGG